MGFLRVSTYTNAYKTKQEKFEGNTDGEGRLLGGLSFIFLCKLTCNVLGVYLIKDDQVVFAHLEKEWGDAVNPKQVEEALNRL
jgi:hypothetical protein